MFPPIPSDVLLALSKAFPERSPHMSDSHAACMARAGEANVVRFLQRKFNEQQDNILTSKFQDVPSVRQDP
jgi:hypothetical protein